MITADQLFCHAVGDYILQSDWQANNKTKSTFAALVHAELYVLPFLFLHPSVSAIAVMAWSHFFIDRFRLARYLVWAKNWLGPNRPWSECSATGYPADRPAWMAVWLMIIADNCVHIAINAACLKFL